MFNTPLRLLLKITMQKDGLWLLLSVSGLQVQHDAHLCLGPRATQGSHRGLSQGQLGLGWAAGLPGVGRDTKYLPARECLFTETVMEGNQVLFPEGLHVHGAPSLKG